MVRKAEGILLIRCSAVVGEKPSESVYLSAFQHFSVYRSERGTPVDDVLFEIGSHTIILRSARSNSTSSFTRCQTRCQTHHLRMLALLDNGFRDLVLCQIATELIIHKYSQLLCLFEVLHLGSSKQSPEIRVCAM